MTKRNPKANKPLPTLRDYQKPLVAACVADYRKGKPEILLAATPGAGKTFMAQAIIQQLVTSKEVNRALVIAWGRKDLLKQWAGELTRFFGNDNWKKKVDLEIHQNVKRRTGPYDLVVVDEAHQFYEQGESASKNIRRLKAQSVLLLTGSPSIFFARNIELGKKGIKAEHNHPDWFYASAVFSLEDMEKEGKASPVEILASIDHNLSEDDYKDGKGREKQEVSDRKQYKPSLTKKTLDDLERLLIDWKQKTLLICKNINQSEQVLAYYKAKGFQNVAISHSEIDPEGNEIKNFMKGPTALLIVVDRCRLGFDFTELRTVIDMSGTRNPDLIFQMLCRVVRRWDNPKTGKPITKRYVKVMADYYDDEEYRFWFSAVLSLKLRRVFSTWDGNHQKLAGHRILDTGEGEGGGGEGENDGDGKPKKLRAFFKFEEHGLCGDKDLFEAAERLKNSGVSNIGQCTIAQVRGVQNRLDGGNKAENIKAIKEYAEKHGHLPATGADNRPEVRRLAVAHNAYSTPNGGSFDPYYAKWAKNQLTFVDYCYRQFFGRLEDFYSKNGFLPRTKSTDRAEQDLGMSVSQKTIQGRSGFCADLLQWTKDKLTFREFQKLEFFKKLKEFESKHGHLPSSVSQDPAERTLRNKLSNYTNPARQGSFCKDIHEWAETKLTEIEFKQNARCQEIKDFYAKTGYLPSGGSKDPAEKRLGLARNFLTSSPDRRAIRPEFIKWLEGKPTWEDYKCQQNIKDIKDFESKSGHLPGNVSNPKEKRLASILSAYRYKEGGSYRADVDEWAAGKKTRTQFEVLQTQQAIQLFYEEHGHLPRTSSEDAAEKKLGIAHLSYISGNVRFNQEGYAKWADGKLAYRAFLKEKNKQEIAEFAEKYGRLPRRTSENANEKRLFMAHQGYIGKTTKSYDSSYAKWAATKTAQTPSPTKIPSKPVSRHPAAPGTKSSPMSFSYAAARRRKHK